MSNSVIWPVTEWPTHRFWSSGPVVRDHWSKVALNCSLEKLHRVLTKLETSLLVTHHTFNSSHPQRQPHNHHSFNIHLLYGFSSSLSLSSFYNICFRFQLRGWRWWSRLESSLFNNLSAHTSPNIIICNIIMCYYHLWNNTTSVIMRGDRSHNLGSWNIRKN